jgi:hypothetical protein
MEDHTPPTQPDGSMMPPPKIPGTAIAVATPPPPRRDENDLVETMSGFGRFIDRTLGAVDRVADVVASGLGLR